MADHDNDATPEEPAPLLSSSDASRWLAYELHDGLLQWIVAANFELEALRDKLHEDPLQAKLLQCQSYLHLALADGRALIGFLESSPSTQIDSATLLSNAVEEARNRSPSGQQIILRGNNSLPQLAPQTLWSLYRIVQQALNNAVKHSGAATIQVNVELRQGQPKPITSGTTQPPPVSSSLHLEIRDDGCGFNLQSKQSLTNHFGLRSMRARARAAAVT